MNLKRMIVFITAFITTTLFAAQPQSDTQEKQTKFSSENTDLRMDRGDLNEAIEKMYTQKKNQSVEDYLDFLNHNAAILESETRYLNALKGAASAMQEVNSTLGQSSGLPVYLGNFSSEMGNFAEIWVDNGTVYAEKDSIVGNGYRVLAITPNHVILRDTKGRAVKVYKSLPESLRGEDS